VKQRSGVALETAAVVLAGCAVGGAIGVVGVLVGLLVARRLREMPRVRCVASDWDLKIYGETGPLGRAVCSFELDLFNEGLATGLRGLSVVFYGEDGNRAAAGRLSDSVPRRRLWTLDLPSRRWVHASVYTLMEGETVRDASGFRRVYLVGEFPDGTTFERKIVERQYFVAARKITAGARKNYLASHNFRSRLLGKRRAAG
jgi:hypothetical protein